MLVVDLLCKRVPSLFEFLEWHDIEFLSLTNVATFKNRQNFKSYVLQKRKYINFSKWIIYLVCAALMSRHFYIYPWIVNSIKHWAVKLFWHDMRFQLGLNAKTFAKYVNQHIAYEIVSCSYIPIIRICNSNQLKLIFALIPISSNQ